MSRYLGLAVLLLGLLAACLAVLSIAISHGTQQAHPTPAFLTKALGSPQATAPRVRTLGGGLKARLDRSVSLERGGTRIGLTADGADGSWTSFVHGATRQTPYGSESVTLERNGVEEFLAVDRHVGTRTWRWRLGSQLAPRLLPGGRVGVVDTRTHRVLPAVVAPVEILDARGRRVTPKGLAWNVDGQDLTLRLDDAQLPASYVIDPSITWRTPGTTSNTGAGANSIALTVPAGVATGDQLIVELVVRGGTGITVTAPTCSCWSLVNRADNGTNISVLGYRLTVTAAQGQPATTYTWNLTAATIAAAAMEAYYGVDNTAPVNATSTVYGSGNSAVNNVPFNSVSPVGGATTFQVGLGGVRSATTFDTTVCANGCVLRAQPSASGGVAAGFYDSFTTAGDTGHAVTAGRAVAQTYALKVDTGAPTSSASITPTATSASSVTVNYTASDAESALQKVDLYVKVPGAGAYTLAATNTSSATSGSFSYTFGSGDGTYQFYTVATDTAGNAEAAPASADDSVVEDTTKPTSSASITPTATSASSVTVNYTASDGTGSGLSKVELYVKVPGAGAYALAATDNAPGASGSFTYTFASGEGNYQFYTVATDVATNVENAPATPPDDSVVYDATKPSSSASITPTATNGASVTVNYTASDGTGSGLSKVELYVKVPGAGAYALAATDNAPGASGSFTYSFANGEGNYQFYTVATDAAANVENVPASPPDDSVISDTTKPSSSASITPTATNAASVTVNYTASDGTGSGLSKVELYVKVPGAGAYALAATDNAPGASGSFTYTFANGEGSYQFYTRATDVATNLEDVPASPPDDSVVSDTTKPSSAASITPIATSAASVTVNYTASDGTGSGLSKVELYVKVPGAGAYALAATDNAPGASGSFTYTFANGEGNYQFYTRATDTATNLEDVPASPPDDSVISDTTKPSSSASITPTVTNGASVTVNYTASDGTGSGLSKVELYVKVPGAGAYALAATDNAPGASGSFLYTFASGDGNYQFYTVATDAASNVENVPASPPDDSVVLDATKPSSSASITPTATNAASVTVNYTASDGTGSGLSKVELYVKVPGAGAYALAATDNAPGASGSFTYTFANGEGNYQFYTRATDAATNLEDVPASPPDDSVISDTTKPASAASITPTLTNASSVTVSYTASDGGSGLQKVELYVKVPGAGAYALAATDNAPGATGSFTYTFGNGDGNYQFYTRATDQASNLEDVPASPPDDSVIYDGTAPSSSASITPTATNAASVTVNYAASDATSALQKVDLYVKVPGAGAYALAATDNAPGASGSFTYTFANGEGNYQFYTRATDTAGNTEAAPASPPDDSVVFDTTKPASAASITPTATNAASVTVNYTAGDGTGSGLQKVELYVKVPGAGAYALGATDNVPGASGSFTYTFANGQGTYFFYTRATDQAGNVEDAPASEDDSVVSDTSAPSSSVSFPSASAYNASGYTAGCGTGATDDLCGTGGDGSGSGVSLVAVKIQRSSDSQYWNGATWQAAAAWVSATGTTSWSYTFAGVNLTNGVTYTVASRATDAAGNVESPSASASFRYDTTAPSPTMTAPTGPTSNATPTFSGAAGTATGDSTTITVKVYDSGSTLVQTRTATASAGSWSVAASPALADGAYTATATQADDAGNSTTTASVSFRVDTTAPTSSASITPTATNAASVTVNYTASDAGGSGLSKVELYVRTPGAGAFALAATDNAPGASGSFTYTFGSGEGNYQYYTRATDQVSNVEAAPGSADDSVVYDTTNPTSAASITPAATNASSVTVNYTASDGGSGLQKVDLYVKVPGAGAYALAATDNAPGTSGSFTYTFGSGEGNYQFYTRATDNASNAEAAPASPPDDSVVYDTTNPASSASITPTATNASSVTVNYTASDGGSGLQKVDLYVKVPGAGAYALAATDNAPGASGSFTYTFGSGEGNYQFYTRATDNASNLEAAPASADDSVVSDTTAPTSSASITPTATNASSVTVNYTASDGGSGLAKVELYVKVPGAGGYALAATDNTPGASGSFTYPFANGEGNYDFYTRATDAAGNLEAAPASADDSVLSDTTKPVSSASITPTVTNGASATVSYSASDGASGLQKVDLYVKVPGAGAYALAATDNAPGATGSFLYTFASGDGNYLFYTVATDNAGNVEDAPASPPDDSILLDATKPASAASIAPAATSAASVSVGYSASDGGSGLSKVDLYVKVPGAGSYTLAATDNAPGATGSFTYTFGSGEGTYRFYSRATDAAGNVEDAPGAEDDSVVWDTTNPSSSVSFPSASAYNAAGYTAGCSTASTDDLCGAAGDGSGSGVSLVEVKIQRSSDSEYWNGATWQVGAAWVSATGTTSWSYGFAATNLTDGSSYTVTSRATDAAGNLESPSGSSTFRYDTTAPAVTITAPSGATNNNNPTFSGAGGTATGDSTSVTVKVYNSSNTLMQTLNTSVSAGSYSVPASFALADGSYTATATQADDAGNSQTTSATSFTVDTAAPSAPTAFAVSPASPANNNSPKVSGTAEAGSTVKLYTNATCTSAVAATGSAATFSSPGLAVSVSDDTSTTYHATATDAAGNTSACSTASVTYVEDSTAPQGLTITSPTGASNNTKPTYSGAAGNAAGDSSTITVKVYDSGNSLVQTLTATRSGTSWMVTATVALTDGNYTATATQADSAGNSSTTSALNFTIDTSLPAVTITAPTGPVATATPIFSGAAGTAGGDLPTITVKVYNSSNTLVQTRTTTQSGGAWSVAASPGLADGTYTATASQSNGAGSTATDGPVSFRVDTAAPSSSISFPSASAYNAAGYTAGCGTGTTDDLCGTAADGSGSGVSLVEVKIQRSSDSQYWNGATWQAGAAWVSASGTTSWSYGFAAVDLTDGVSYTVTSRATDAAGNVESPSAGASFRYDTTAPSPTITTPSGPTSSATPTFSGAAGTSTGDSTSITVKVYDSGNTLVQTRAATASAGSWSVVASPALAEGAYTATATQADDAGNSTTTGAISFRVDTTAPTSSASVTPTSTNTASLTVSYTAGDGSGSGLQKVELYVKTPGAGAYALAATDNAPGASGSFSYTLTSEGNYDFYTRATDNAGNAEPAPASADDSVVYDTTSPTSAAAITPASTNAGSVTVNYTASDGGSGLAKVELYVKAPGAGSYSLAATDNTPGASGSFTYTFASGEGNYQFYTRATDNASNVEAAPASPPDDAVVYDTTNPVSAASVTPTATNAASVSVDYAASDGGSGLQKVELYVKTPGAGSYALAATDNTPGASGSFTYTFANGEGNYDFYTRATDNAGNVEAAPASADDSVLSDTTNPSSSASITPTATNNASVTVNYTAGDGSGSGLQKVQLYVKTPGAGSYALAATDNTPGASGSFSYTLTSEGNYDFYTRATDNAGNLEAAPASADDSVLSDTTNPTSSASIAPTSTNAASISVTYSASDDSAGLQKVELYVKTPGAGSYALAATDNTPGATGSFTYTFANGEGNYDFYTRATDNAGNLEGAPASADDSVLSDTTNPTSAASIAPTSTNAASVSVAYSASDGGSGLQKVQLYVKTPGAASFALAATDNTPGATGSFTYTFANGEGSYDFYTRATDNAGNVEAAPASADDSVLSDTTNPTSSASVTPTATNAASLSVGYTAGDGSGAGLQKVELYVKTPGAGSYALAATDNTPGASGSFSYTLTSEGNYDFYTRATDNAGNLEAAPASADDSVLFDTTNPTSAASITPASTNAGAVTVGYSASDDSAGLQKVQLYVKTPGAGAYALAATDNAPGASGSFTYTFANGEGNYDFYTRATDNAGNLEAAPASADDSVLSDTTNPTSSASITPTSTNAASVSVDYSASDSSSGLQRVQLYVKTPGAGAYALAATDNAPGATGSFTYTFANGEGTYDFYTRATDNAGNVEAAPASADDSVLSDTTNPTSSASITPASTNAASVTVGYTASDSASGLQKVELYVKTPGAGAYALAATDNTPGATGSFTYTFAAGEGSYDFYTRATDNAGNVEAAPASADDSVLSDTTNPTSSASITPAATNAASVSVGYSASDGGSGLQKIELYVKTPGAGSYALAATDNSPGATGSFTYTFAAGEGSYQFYTRATDNAGNVEAAPASADDSVLSDTTNPTSSASIAPTSTNNATLSVGYTASDGGSGLAKVDLYVKTPGAGSYALAATDNSPGATGSLTYTLTTAGTYDFYTRATDNAGNVEAAPGTPDDSVLYDTGAPSSSVSFPSAGAYNAAGYTGGCGTGAADDLCGTAADGSGSGVSLVELRIRRASDSAYWNGATWQAGAAWIAASGTTSWSYGFAGVNLTDGVTYTVTSRATDAAGNVESPSGSASFRYDTTPPAVTLTSPAGPTNNNAPTFSGAAGTATGDAASVTVKVYNASNVLIQTLTATPSAGSYSVDALFALADGNYTATATQSDDAGNSTTTAASSFRIDTVAPAAPSGLGSSPASPANNNSPKITGTAEAGSTVKLYTNATCTSAVAATGTAAAFASPGLAVSVSDDTSTTFYATATDAAGNTGVCSAGFIYVEDSTAPQGLTIASPTGSTNNTSPTFSGAAGTAAGDSSTVTVKVYDSSSTLVQTRTATVTGGSWSVAASPALADGSYTATVTQADSASNSSTAGPVSFTVDTVAPAPTADAPSGWTNSSTPTLSGTAGTAAGDGTTITVKVYDASNTLVQTRTVTATAGAWSLAASPALADGAYTAKASQTDAAGNTGTSAATSFTVDTVGPAVTITAPTGVTASNQPTLSGAAGSAAGDAGTVTAKIYDSGNSLVQTLTASVTAGTWSVPASPALADGAYTAKATQTDAAGNSTTSSAVSFTVDTTAPLRPTGLGVTPASPANQNAPKITGTAEPGSTVKLYTNSTCTSAVAATGTAAAFASPGLAVSVSDDTSTAFYATATDAAGNTSLCSTSSATFVEDSTAPTVSMTSPANGANVGSSVTLSATASDAVDPSPSITFQYSPSGAGSWTSTPSTWNTTSLADGAYDVRAVATDSAGNSRASAVVTVNVDNHAPTVSISSPGQYVSAADADPFTVTATSSDGDINHVDFYACQDTSTGCSSNLWTFLGSDSVAPFTATWTLPATDGNRALKAVAFDNAANQGSAVKDTLVDRQAPSGGSVSYPTGYRSGSLTITTSNGSDGGSGLDLASAQILRDDVALSADACGTFPGTTTSVSSPDTGLTSGHCYEYSYRIADKAGNVATYGPAGTVKVDTSAPSAPSLSFSALTAAYDAGSNTVYYRPGTSGGFTVTASSSDAESDVASYSFPTFGAGWSVSGSGASRSYSYTGTPAQPGSGQNVTASNNAGLTSAATAFTVTADAAAPSGGSVSYANGPQSATSVDVSFAAGTDSGSGLATGRLLQRADATLSGGSCTGWSAFATLATDPGSPYTDSTIADGHCYQYRYVVSDRVGNQATYTSSSVVEVDATPPSAATLDALPAAIRNGQALTGSGSDAGSGVASIVYYECAGSACTPTTAIGASSAGPNYSVTWNGQPADGTYTVLARVLDAAGNSLDSATRTVTIDNTSPTGSLTAPASGANVRATVTVSSDSADGTGSGVASARFERSPAGANTWTAIGTATGAPYQASFDTTNVTDGQYDLRVMTTDVAGNSFTSPVRTVRVDNTAPAGSVTAPADGAKVRLTVTLSANPSDGGSGVASAQFQRSPAGAGTWLNVGSALTGAPWQVALDTTTLVDGLYDLRVVTTDNAGNVGNSAAVTVRVDNTPPSVTWLSPTAGAAVSGSVTLSTSTSDADPSPTVSYEVAPHGTTSWSPVSSPWDTTAIADGHYDLRATATDWTGNTNAQVVSDVVADNNGPNVSLTAPADNSFVNAASPDPVALTATASDAASGVAQVEFFYCSNANCAGGTQTSLGTDTTAPYTGSWNVGADGTHAVKAVATDNAGHSSASVANVIVDRTAPDTSIVTKPGDPSKQGSATFTFTGSDPSPSSGAPSFQCSLDGSGWSTCSSGDTFALGTDGVHSFSVRSVDAAGNADGSPASWTWHRDTGAPTASLNDPGRNVRGTITLGAPNSDPLQDGYASGVASVTYQYSLDGSTWVTVGTSTSAPYDTMSWNTTGVGDAIYQLRVVATDAAGNATTSAVVTNVRVDNTPPATAQDDPGAYLRGTKTLTGTASDTGSGVQKVDFQYSPAGAGSWTTIASDATAPYSLGFDSTAVADGHYDFRTLAYDVAGNSAPSAVVADRLVDNTPPTAAMNDPGAYLRGTVTLGSTNSDPGGANASGIASVSYEYASEADGIWHPTSSSWDTTSPPDGLYDLRVTVVDNAGNSTTSAAVTARRVDNTKPVTTDNAPAGYQNGAVVVTLSPSDSGSGVQTTEYKLDSAASYSAGTSVTVPAVDGSHTIQYFSVDRAGNIEGVKTATVLIDTTPPVCPSCSAGDYLRGTVTLTANPSDSGAGIQSVEFQYSPDGSTWTSIAPPVTTAPYTADWNTGSVADGAYHLRAHIVDGAGNPSDVDLHPGGAGVVVVDNTAPTADIGSPSEGAVVSDTTTIAALANDANPVTYRFTVNGATIASGAAPSASWNTSSVADGPAQLQVVVTDAAGNSTTSAVRNVTVDNLAPSPTLNDPGAAVGGTVTLGATSDGDTAQVQFQRAPSGSGSWSTIGSDATAPFTASFDTTAVADGLYDLRVVATDQTGHVGVSSLRTVRVDNTAPTGSVTKPAAGATIGGPGVKLAASASDSGAGVGSVKFEYRPTGGGAWTVAATATASPWEATWDATSVATGDYDFHAIITDNAGNSHTTAAVTAHIDSTAPTVVLSDPGANLSGTATLAATVSGPDAAKVVFAYSPAGANSWTSIATDTASPWSAAFDTRTVGDGVYDLRAVASDSLGNSSTSVRTNIRIDNTAPTLVSTDPVDGDTIAGASSIVLNASEVVTMQSVTLDGASTVAPIVTGTRIEYPTGPLGQGPHTLAGEIVDAAGKTVPFRLHFTIWNGTGDAPYVEKNTALMSATTLEAANDAGSVMVPSGAWPANGADWMVVRIDSTASPAVLGAGLPSGSPVYDVTGRWALAGTELHEFQQPLAITIPAPGSGYVPVTNENGTWREIRYWNGSIPSGWSDSFEYVGGGIRIWTMHLSQFALVRDVSAPTAPTHFRGSATDGVLSLAWEPGTDDSGVIAQVLLLIDGVVAQSLPGGTTSTTVNPFEAGDSRTFTLRDVDAAGNQSGPSTALKAVPPVAGKSLAAATADLQAAGFSVGDVTEGEPGSGVPGTVVEPSGIELASPGSAIDLVVAPGSTVTPFVFKVTTPPTFSWAKSTRIVAHVKSTRAAKVSVTLLSPKRLRLYVWRLQVRAGASLVKLRMPTQVRRPGRYTLVWLARSDGDTVRKSARLRILPSGEKLGRVVNPGRNPVAVVLAGDGVDTGLGAGSSGGNVRYIQASDSDLFEVAADATVKVIVLDVDQYGVGMVRDLHSVFPGIHLVALAGSQPTLDAARAAGADAALPSSTPTDVLRQVVARLVK